MPYGTVGTGSEDEYEMVVSGACERQARNVQAVGVAVGVSSVSRYNYNEHCAGSTRRFRQQEVVQFKAPPDYRTVAGTTPL